MENVKIIERKNGYKKIIPDKGYILKIGNRYYSEAIIKNIDDIIVIKDE